MKKNWALFILIFIGAYGYMIMDQWHRETEYKQKQETYEVELAKWQAEQDRIAEEKERQRQEILRLRTGEAPVPSGTPADRPTTAAAAPGAEPAASESGDDVAAPALPLDPISERRLLTLLGDPTQTPIHTVETPLYRVVLSELGARPIRWEVNSSRFVTNINGPEDGSTTTTMTLIPQVGDAISREYPLEVVGSGVREFNRTMFTLERGTVEGNDVLTFTSDPVRDGVVLRKTFTFRPDSYVVDIAVEYVNGTERRQALGRDTGLGIGWQGGFGNPEIADRVLGNVTAVYASNDGKVRTRTLRKGERVEEITTPVDWVGQEKKYFAAVLAPADGRAVERMRISRASNDAMIYQGGQVAQPLSVDMLHPEVELAPGASVAFAYQLFVGPKNREALVTDDWALPATVTPPGNIVFHAMPLGMSVFRNVCLALLYYLRLLHEYLGVWGLAIIGTTLTVRLLILPLTHWAIKNQARMMVEQEKIRPEMQEIMKKYKNDAMKRSQAMMELYQAHEINPVLGPLRGCVPVLLQMPIFLALYVLFDQAVELRGQSFLWIRDLSAPDALIYWGVKLPLIGSALNILPIIMSFTNYGMMKIMQMPAQDEMQEKIQKQMMYMMPVMMLVFLYHMPAGLTLYWTVSNLFSIGQSVYTKRVMHAHKEKHKARLEAAKPGTKATPAVEVQSSTVR